MSGLTVSAVIAPLHSEGASEGKFTRKPRATPSASYCLALRGNGELAPSHWGALAQVVEKLGLPKAMAGGSSASINLFLLESIALNSNVASARDENARREAASLLLKSLEAYLDAVVNDPQWTDLKAAAAYLKQASGEQAGDAMSWIGLLTKTPPSELAKLLDQNGAVLQAAFKRGVELGVLNEKTLAPLVSALKDFEKLPPQSPDPTADPARDPRMLIMNRIYFFANEIYQSFILLGKFNAESDQNLFFRSGLIDFAALGHSFGRAANFYAEREMPSAVRDDLRKFTALCAPLAKGKTWSELRSINPSCEQNFKSVLASYRALQLPAGAASREHDKIGSVIPTFPTTAVLTGKAAQTASMSLALYPMAMDPNFGQKFKIDGSDVAFGYWGRKKDLTRIAKNLKTPFTDGTHRRWDFSNDEKSGRFLALGEAPWINALRSSPAEPGLAPFQKLDETLKGQTLYSAGGWSDLHPVAVLKAAGCDNVVYVTRRGGESLFGQGVAKRLFGFPEVSWDILATDPARKAANVIRNNNGDAKDLTSQWSRLYNLANPESSFNRALGAADAVVCTDWNNFDVQKPGAVLAMIQDAYQARWAVRDAASKFASSLSSKGATFVTPAENVMDSALGYRPYAGCLAF